MTYQNTSEPFAAPSRNVATSAISLLRRSFAAIGSFLGRFGESLMRANEASTRIEQMQVLQAKSDEELARLGIKRDGIVHHVFRDLYYS